jgi:ribosome-associated translation inhibitor RaiA
MVVVQGGAEYGRFSIVFHNMGPSDAVRGRAEHLLEKLLRFSPTIIRGTLTIEARHRHHHQGNVYHVSLNLHLPGRDIVVSHDPELDHAHEDVYVALRDACNAAKKQLAALERFSGKGAQHAKTRFESNPRKGDQFWQE